MSLRSPLGRVLGLGSAKSGYAQWWGQRLSAAALVPLGLWFLVSIAGMPVMDHASVAAWVGEPLHAILLILFQAAIAYHSNLGVQEVIEDYVHHGAARVISLVLVSFVHVALAVAGIYAVMTLSLAGRT